MDGFFAVFELVLIPSFLNSHIYDVVPAVTDLSVNCTVSGALPCVVLAVNWAIGDWADTAPGNTSVNKTSPIRKKRLHDLILCFMNLMFTTVYINSKTLPGWMVKPGGYENTTKNLNQ
jgi:hypothetical protein